MTLTHTQRYFLFPAIAVLFIFLFETAAVRDGIQDALTLSYLAVVPSVFPFAVLSGYLMGQLRGNSDIPCLRPLSRFLGLPRGGEICFLLGLLCGFPLGARCVADGYRNGLFTKKEAERMLLFCNNTGPAFLVGGIGSMRGCASDGWHLFAIQFILVILTALITKKHVTEKERRVVNTPRMTFAQAVSSGVTATLTVLGFVLFFSACIAILDTFFPKTALVLISSFLEVSTAAKLAANIPCGIVITAFAVCFSGISVHLQTAALLGDTDLSLRPYLLTKIIVGILGATLSFLLLLG